MQYNYRVRRLGARSRYTRRRRPDVRRMQQQRRRPAIDNTTPLNKMQYCAPVFAFASQRSAAETGRTFSRTARDVPPFNGGVAVLDDSRMLFDSHSTALDGGYRGRCTKRKVGGRSVITSSTYVISRVNVFYRARWQKHAVIPQPATTRSAVVVSRERKLRSVKLKARSHGEL
jgi:hypothetical protein